MTKNNRHHLVDPTAWWPMQARPVASCVGVTTWALGILNTWGPGKMLGAPGDWLRKWLNLQRFHWV